MSGNWKSNMVVEKARLETELHNKQQIINKSDSTIDALIKERDQLKARVAELEGAIGSLGYKDGAPASQVSRPKAYCDNEIKLLRGLKEAKVAVTHAKSFCQVYSAGIVTLSQGDFDELQGIVDTSLATINKALGEQ